jgi:hypothetical protein
MTEKAVSGQPKMSLRSTFLWNALWTLVEKGKKVKVSRHLWAPILSAIPAASRECTGAASRRRSAGGPGGGLEGRNEGNDGFDGFCPSCAGIFLGAYTHNKKSEYRLKQTVKTVISVICRTHPFSIAAVGNRFGRRSA